MSLLTAASSWELNPPFELSTVLTLPQMQKSGIE